MNIIKSNIIKVRIGTKLIFCYKSDNIKYNFSSLQYKIAIISVVTTATISSSSSYPNVGDILRR